MKYGTYQKLMAKRTPPHEEYPAWTEAKFNQFVRSQLRAGWNKWPPKYEVLNLAKRIVTGKRHKYEYQCNSCKNWFKGTEVEVDHIESAGSSKDWNSFIKRLYVGVKKLQVLCKPCHNDKTLEERTKNG